MSCDKELATLNARGTLIEVEHNLLKRVPSLYEKLDSNSHLFLNYAADRVHFLLDVISERCPGIKKDRRDQYGSKLKQYNVYEEFNIPDQEIWNTTDFYHIMEKKKIYYHLFSYPYNQIDSSWGTERVVTSGCCGTHSVYIDLVLPGFSPEVRIGPDRSYAQLCTELEECGWSQDQIQFLKWPKKEWDGLNQWHQWRYPERKILPLLRCK